MTKRRAIRFSAVSSEDQADPSKPSLDVQDARTAAYCAGQDWPVVAHIRVEGHSRGIRHGARIHDYTRLDRLIADCPEYAQLVTLIEARVAEVIVVTAYDRLWRSDALRAQVAALCRDKGVRILALDSPVPLDSDETAFWMELFYGAFAQQETASRVRRFKAGMIGRVKRGLAAARSIPPYGYRYVARDQPFETDPTTAPIVRDIYAWRVERDGYTGIARRLNTTHIPAPRGGQWWGLTVSVILRNPYYVGDVVLKQEPGTPPITAHGQHTPLIDRATWQLVQDIGRARYYMPRRHNPEHVFAGLARCEYCGETMAYIHRHWTHANGSPGGNLQLLCGRYSHRRGCQRNGHMADPFHAFMYATIRGALVDSEAFLQAVENRDEGANAYLHILEERATEAQTRLQRIYDLAEAGVLPTDEASQRTAEWRVQLAQVQAERTRFDDFATRHAARRVVITNMRDTLPQLQRLGPETYRAIAYALIDRVILRKEGDPEIVWR